MLQPSQIGEVSVRYASHIAELRAFLLQAGLTPGKDHSLDDVVTRLQHDRAFHRDLTSHVWVLMDRCDPQTSVANLLGVVAIAAAGERLAAMADENNAHNLLRFVMDAGRSFERAAISTTSTSSVEKHSVRPLAQVVPRRGSSIVPTPQAVHASPPVSMSNPGDSPQPQAILSRTGRNILVAVAVCIVVAVVAGRWLHKSTRDVVATKPEPAAARIATSHLTEQPASSGNDFVPHSELLNVPSAAFATAARNALNERRNLSIKHHVSDRIPEIAPGPTSVVASVPAAPAMPAPPANTASAVVPASGTSSMPPTAHATTSVGRFPVPAATGLLALRSSAPPPPLKPTVPSAWLSKQLGSPTPPAGYTADTSDRNAGNPKYPHLLRRPPPSMLSDNGNALVAAAGSAPAVPAAKRGVTSVPVRPGTVRPAALGIMAANLLYSPTPAYPSAASAANVQGEVRVLADVDREGNVASVRVISGPPLLRDAALDAVQHWRYRPFVSGGKPVSMSATAVVDFELQ